MIAGVTPSSVSPPKETIVLTDNLQPSEEKQRQRDPTELSPKPRPTQTEMAPVCPGFCPPFPVSRPACCFVGNWPLLSCHVAAENHSLTDPEERAPDRWTGSLLAECDNQKSRGHFRRQKDPGLSAEGRLD